jgi:hypothetical protein
MASATRLRADSSIEHTIEGYQLGGVCVHAYGNRACTRLWLSYPQVVGVRLWILAVDNQRENTSQVFLPHTRWIMFPQLEAA